ncbi:rhomboid family intramembrane serine protease [Streptosporangiaceae bacterium NEAU-GS5]|nr:rhomboid family intramembrane serine protease [Streptosporangiaceae bacterium NEAU-GS5]
MTTQPPSTEPGAEAVPTCYRHPERETYVRCQRCERPICPDCMREAAVGHQCVECVREGNQAVRQAAAPFGGGVVVTPYVTWTLIVVNVLMFAGQTIVGTRLTNELSMINYGVADGQWYRLITSAFLHYGVFHIAFNMYALYVIGPYLERAFGHTRFLALYLLGALGGSVLSYWFQANNAASAGASGAIFGLFAAAFIVGRRMGMDIRGLVTLIVINLVITFIPGFGISWTAHVGGLLTGAIVAAALAYAPKGSARTAVQLTAVLVICAALVVLTVARTNMLLA